MDLTKYNKIADESKWKTNLRLVHIHSLQLHDMIFGLLKDDWKDRLITPVYFGKRRKKPAIRRWEKDEIIVQDLGMLSIIAEECFNRGILYILDEMSNVDNAGEIYTSLKDDDRQKVRDFFLNRIEMVQKELRARPVAPVKYTDDDFREVDKTAERGIKQSAALDEVSLRHGFKRESFEKQYRKRWLNRKVKMKH